MGNVLPALRFASYWIKHALLRGIFDLGADRADVANAADGIKMLRIFGNDQLLGKENQSRYPYAGGGSEKIIGFLIAMH